MQGDDTTNPFEIANTIMQTTDDEINNLNLGRARSLKAPFEESKEEKFHTEVRQLEEGKENQEEIKSFI